MLISAYSTDQLHLNLHYKQETRDDVKGSGLLM